MEKGRGATNNPKAGEPLPTAWHPVPVNDLTTNLTPTALAGLTLLALLSGVPSASAEASSPVALLPDDPVLLDCTILGQCGPLAAAGAEPGAVAMTPDGVAFDCATAGLCDAIAEALSGVGQAYGVALVALYQDVYPNGQFGYFDCVYDSATNRSIIVERWGVHVEAGTLSGSTRNPIVNTNVYYPFVDTAVGNAC